jgi:hypothetical protein
MAKSTNGTNSTSGEVKARRTPGRRKTDKAPAQPPALASDRGGAVVAPTPREAAASDWADVQRRAFEIYLERGGVDGHDVEDWFEAERQLRGGRE